MNSPARGAVTVVVVVYDAPRARIDECLDSIEASEGVDTHIVLVDNGSADPGVARAAAHDRAATTLLRRSQNGGFAAGVNAGLARAAGSDAVMLLNDDARVLPDTIACALAALRRGGERCIAVAPKVLLADEPDRIDSVGTVLRPNGEAFNAGIGQPDIGQFANGTQVFGACFGAALFRHDAFTAAAVGPLDERFFLYYEDIDWNIRAFRRGWVTLSATDAVVLHAHATSTRRMGEARRFRIVQRNLLLCMSKHLAARDLLALWARRTVVHAKGFVRGPYRWARLALLAGALVRLPPVLVDRCRHSVSEMRDDAAMFAFAAGMEPYFDATTYRASRTDEAGTAAERARRHIVSE